MMPRPTSSSDVPGPIVYLYNDETVPLYNFSSFNIRNYSDNVDNDYTPWQFISPPDISGNNETTNYLILYNSINQTSYTYTITVPLGIYVYGTSKLANLPGKMTLQIKNASVSAYYNNKLYGTYSSPAFDTSMSLVFDVSNATPGSFNASYFAGNATFSGVQLYTSPSFVYSFSTNVVIDLTVANDPNYNTASYFGTAGLKYGPVINMSINTNSTNGQINVSYASGTMNVGGSFITGI